MGRLESYEEHICDPEHLDSSSEDHALLEHLVPSYKSGLVEIDDSTVLAHIHGALMREIDEDLEEDGYRYDPDEVAYLERSRQREELRSAIEEVYRRLFLEMASEENFARMVEACQTLDPDCEIPENARQILLEKIAEEGSFFSKHELFEKFKKPVLIIVPKNDINKKIKKHKGANVTHNERLDIPMPENVRICVIDAALHREQPEDMPTTAEDRLEYELEKYKNIAGAHEMAVLFQLQMMEAERTGRTDQIIDNTEGGPNTITMLRPEDQGAYAEELSCAHYRSNKNRARFFKTVKGKNRTNAFARACDDFVVL